MIISVNADDFGINESVSKTIIQFIQEGICDTTTVMVNMPNSKNIKNMAVFEGISNKVGIHLNLTEGVPITAEILSYQAFVSGGTFGCYKKNRFKRFLLDRKEKNAVRNELRAQIEQYLSLGYTGMTMDSHQGIHMDWSIYPIVIDLFEEYGFKFLRRSPNLKNDLKRKILRMPFDASIDAHGIQHMDYLGNFNDFKLHSEYLQKSEKRIEIMCHPKQINGITYIDWCSNLKVNDFSKEIAICKNSKLRGKND